MDQRLSRQELHNRLHGLRTAVVVASGVAFLAALGLVATNPQGTQAAGGQPPAQDPSQPAADTGAAPSTSYGSPVTNAPANQQPLLHSRRS